MNLCSQEVDASEDYYWGVEIVDLSILSRCFLDNKYLLSFLLMIDFRDHICEYQEGSDTQSPIWIWFQRSDSTTSCQICKSKILINHGSSTNLIAHLKRHHGFLKKYNAFKEHKELSNLKQERLQKCKRKNSVATNNESGGWISCAKAWIHI